MIKNLILQTEMPGDFNQLHLNAMYDLLDKIYTDIIIQPGKIENEHKAFLRYGRPIYRNTKHALSC